MAAGDLKGTPLSVAANSITNPTNATGSVAVVVGDLVYAVLFQQTALTVSSVTDNLGNTYNAANAGTDAGTTTGRAFWSRVTTAGTLTTVSFAATASANNVVAIAAVIEGPFLASPLDANPANIANDNATPYTCPATGTLAQASEVVMCWICHTGNPTLTASSPNTIALQLATASILKGAIGRQTVAATTSVAPEFTSSATPTDSCYGTTSFKLDLTQALTPDLYTNASGFVTQTVTPGPVDLAASLYSDAETFFTQTVAATYDLAPTLYVDADTFYTQTISLAAAQAAIGGGAGAYGELAYGEGIVPTGAADIAPSLFANLHTFYTQTVTPGAVNLSPALFADGDAFFTQVVAAGAVDLAPLLFTDGDTFFTQTVAAIYGLTAALYSDGDTFFTQVVAPGSVNLAPTLYSDVETYYEQTISAAGAAAQIALGGGAGAYGELAYGEGIVPTGAADIAPSLFANLHTFYTQTVTPGAVNLSPALFADGDAFFTQVVTAGAVNMAPSLYSDPETYYEQAISAGAGQLVASLYSDPDGFHTSTVTLGVYNVLPDLYLDPDTFRTQLIEGGVWNIIFDPLIDPDRFYVPSVYIITSAIIVPSEELATMAVERPAEMRWRKHRPAPRTKPSARLTRVTPTGFLRR